MRRWSIYLSAAALAFLGGAAVPAQAGGIAPDLKAQVETKSRWVEKITVIVRFKKSGVKAKAIARDLGGKLIWEQPLISGAGMLLPKKSVAALAAYPTVAWVSPDRPTAKTSDCDTPTMALDQAWSRFGKRGSGVGVAVLDTGIYPGTPEWNAGRKSRIIAWKDLVGGKGQPYDDNGHGTHVSGVVMQTG